MTTDEESKGRLERATFKATELTLWELHNLQQHDADRQIMPLVQFVLSRQVETDAEKIQPQDLFNMTLREMTAFMDARVEPGIKKAHAAEYDRELADMRSPSKRKH